MKRSPLPLIIGALVLLAMGGIALVGIIAAAVSGGGSSSRGSGGFLASLPMFGDRIGLLEVNGVLGEGAGFRADTRWLGDQVRDWTNDNSIKGMVVRINSPGGAVSATHDLFMAIEEFRRADKPVYITMGDVAASGGIYLAMAGDEVYANGGTLTGSIGVILSSIGYYELFDRLGLEQRTIKSGEFKDAASGARPLGDAERELLETLILDVHEQFVDIVLEARGDAVRGLLAEGGQEVDDEKVATHIRAFTDGRVFSGRQAVELGFVDGILSEQEVIQKMKQDLGIAESGRVVRNRRRPTGLFGPAVRTMAQIEERGPGTVKLEYRFAP